MKKIVSSAKPSFDICTLIPKIKFDENEAYENILYQNSISKSRLNLFITTQNYLKSTLPEEERMISFPQ